MNTPPWTAQEAARQLARWPADRPLPTLLQSAHAEFTWAAARGVPPQVGFPSVVLLAEVYGAPTPEFDLFIEGRDRRLSPMGGPPGPWTPFWGHYRDLEAFERRVQSDAARNIETRLVRIVARVPRTLTHAQPPKPTCN